MACDNPFPELRDQLKGLLSKDTVMEVSTSLYTLGFYSYFFVIDKKDGSRQPILGLRVLN